MRNSKCSVRIMISEKDCLQQNKLNSENSKCSAWKEDLGCWALNFIDELPLAEEHYDFAERVASSLAQKLNISYRSKHSLLIFVSYKVIVKYGCSNP